MVIRLAWRSIWRYRRRTYITIASIGLGLAFAIFFLAMAEGVYERMIDDVARMQAGHITLEPPGYRDAPAVDLFLANIGPLRERIEAMPGVEETKALILGQGVARSGSGAVGVAVMGVEPAVEAATSPLARNLVDGAYLAPDDGARIVVGRRLAERLDLETGKKVVLSSNDAHGDLVEELCRVRGIFETGSDEFDGYFVQVPIDFARRLYDFPAAGATQLGVVLRDADDTAEIRTEIRAGLAGAAAGGTSVGMSGVKPSGGDAETPGAGAGGGCIAVYTWREIVPEIASYIRLDKGSNVVFQILLLFLILFTIFNTILMSVLEREREFAVMTAIGTPAGLIRQQVIAESALIALAGCAAGLLLGGLAAQALRHWGLDVSRFLDEGFTISGFAVSSVLRAKLTAAMLAWSGGLVFVATLILSLIPMQRAARVPVVDVLR